VALVAVQSVDALDAFFGGVIIWLIFFVAGLVFVLIVVVDVSSYIEFSQEADALTLKARRNNIHFFNRLKRINDEVADLFGVPSPILMIDYKHVRCGPFAAFYSLFFSKTFIFISSDDVIGFNDIEIMGGFAHELAHIVRRHKPATILRRALMSRNKQEEYLCDEIASKVVGKYAMSLCLAKLGAGLLRKMKDDPHRYMNKENMLTIEDLIIRIERIINLK